MHASIIRALEAGIDYSAYRKLMDRLTEEGRTTGPRQSAAFIHYTKLNTARMKRLDKKVQLRPEAATAMQRIRQPETWLVITESWCGDAAQILPVINKMAAINPNIRLLHVMRDEHPELMDQFLTNGSRSIPMVIRIDEKEQKVLGAWGPRPAEAQQMVIARKQDPNPAPYDEFQVALQKWYTRDKGLSTQEEFLAVF